MSVVVVVSVCGGRRDYGDGDGGDGASRWW